MTTTLSEVLTPHGVEIPAHLEAQMEVPCLHALQRQGDVMIAPMRRGKVEGLEPVPSEGIAVVRGEAGGNTHILVADGAVSYARKESGQTIGTLVVGDGGAAFLIHPEHGATGIAPGTYRVLRQREQADEIRVVAD